MKTSVLKSAITGLLFIVLCSPAYSQAPGYTWATGFGNSDTYQQYLINAVDANGNVLVAGNFVGSITLGPTTYSGVGIYDCFMAKYDANGNFLWGHIAGGEQSDFAYGITSDASGNVYVTGYFASQSISFGTYTLNGTSNAGAFLVKYDPSGNALWAKKYGQTSDVFSKTACLDASGNIWFTGLFENPGLTLGTTSLTNTGNRDLLLTKCDASGNALWAKSGTGTDDDVSTDMCLDASGNVYVTGFFKSPTLVVGNQTLTCAGGRDALLLKFDPQGTLLWAKSAGGSFDELSQRVRTDASGNVFITGSYASASVAFGSTTLTNSGAVNSNDMFLTKYDASGNVLWAHSLNGSGDENGYGLSVNPAGDIIATGDFSTPTLTIGSHTLTNIGASDAFYMGYSSSGNLLWASNTGGLGRNGVYSAACDATGGVVLFGAYSYTPITLGTFSLAPPPAGNSSSNLFLARLQLPTATGIVELSGENNKTCIIFPNPGNNFFTLYSDAAILKTEVLNGSGDEISTQDLSASPVHETVLDLSQLPAGTYFIRVHSQESVVVRKLVLIK